MNNLLTPQLNSIPAFLRELPYWNSWAAVKRGTKITKPPVSHVGKLAKVNDTSTWTSFDKACVFYQSKHGKTINGTGGPIAGIGILLQPDFSLVGIDFDGIIIPNTKEIVEWARPFIQSLTKFTYCELSPSGTGVRSFLFGHKSTTKCRHDSLEVYSHARFLTITGHKLNNCPDKPASGDEAQAMINTLVNFIEGKEKSPQGGRENTSSQSRQSNANASSMPTNQPEPLTDSEVLEYGRRYTNGFSALYDSGDISRNGNDHSAADLALANYLAYWTAKDAAQMDRLMRESALLRDPARMAKWNKIHSQSATYGEMTIARAIQDCHKVFERRTKKEKKATQTIKTVTIPDTGKPKIIYRPGELPRLMKEIDASLRGKIWRMDRMLVHIEKLSEARSHHGLRKEKGASIIAPFDLQSVSLLANKCALWVKLKENKDNIEEKPIEPNERVMKIFLGATGDWTCPVLTGLINCPIIRYDGSILDKPGHDPITGLYADFDAKHFPPVVNNPDKNSAIDALNFLKYCIEEFPFKTNVDRSVALAAMLTSVLRPSVKSAPLFALSAPTPGTGKSTLADLIGIMATGKQCASMNFSKEETEFEKAILATLLEGSPVTLIDNVVGELNHSALNIVLSQETYAGRILGQSKMAKLSTNSLWLATGNNIAIVGDLTRRTLLCTLDAEVEKPAERVFKRDIYQWATDHRGKIVQSASIILRAFYLAGQPLPDGIKPMNGFNDWSRWVRGALLWLGESDPKDSQLEIEAHDPERQGLRTVLQAWYAHFGSQFVTTKDLLERVAPDVGNIPDSQQALYQALNEAVIHGRELTGRLLGKWLARNNGKVIDGLKLIKSKETRENYSYWKVITK